MSLAEMARAERFDQSGERRAGYHVNAGMHARLLRGIAERLGVRRAEGNVVDVRLHGETALIGCVTIKSGQNICADLFIGCSGVHRRLSERPGRAA